MKFKFLLGLLAATLVSPVISRAEGVPYHNESLVLAPPAIPPQIDAPSFINENGGEFIINYTNLLPFIVPPAQLPDPFEMQNVLDYTNTFNSFMSCNSGFRLEYFNPSIGQRQRAANFVNEGVIHSGTIDTSNTFEFASVHTPGNNFTFQPFGTIAGTKFILSATNILNPGDIAIGFESVGLFKGGSINMDRGSVTMETQGVSTVNFSAFFDGGIFDGYWATGKTVINPSIFESQPPRTPQHLVEDRNYNFFFTQLIGSNALSYLNVDTDPSGSNILTQAVFVNSSDSNFQANVYFDSFESIIEFTNNLGTTSNNLYILDHFASDPPLQTVPLGFTSLVPHGTAGNRITFEPYNYLPSPIQLPFNFFFGTPASPAAIPPGTFSGTGQTVTNDYAAYQAIFRPTSILREDITGQDYSNAPGRIEITADSYLSLSNSRIQSLNYILLKSTNEFGGSPGSDISAPYYDVYLRDTNGLLAITNVIPPTVPRPEGFINLYSARWTNLVAGITNRYAITFVDAHVSPFSPNRIEHLSLWSTNSPAGTDNLVINDILRVDRSLLLDSARITIATNDPSSRTLNGAIDVFGPSIIWSSATPRLQFLTNFGYINASNTMYFGGQRFAPYYASSFLEPYQVFINGGGVTNFGTQISANLFENTGTFMAGNGAIRLDSQTSILLNGAFLATNNLITINASSLQISNHALVAGGALTLQTSSILDDGSLNPTGADSADYVTNKNIWLAGNGFNLLASPFGSASLLATTITNRAPAFKNALNRSAARDLGCSTAGFNKNAAIGRMVLDGGTNSLFTFSPVTGNNAFYIDELDLENYATNSTGSNFFGIKINAGMKIYFGNATANGVSIAEKLDGANNGRFCWVKDYNCGFFSSTNMVYPDGSTNRVNTALAQDCNVDTDGDGTVNCLDLSPIPPTGSSCTSAPFPPVVVPVPAITSGSTTGGSTGGNSQGGGFDSAGNPKIGTPPTTDSTNGPATFLKGVYVGLFSDVSNGVATANSGYFTVSTTTHGKFTAKIILGGHTYSASGLFGQDGQATVKFRRGSLRAITASLQLDDAGGQITGTLTDTVWTSTLIADRLVFTKKGKSAGDFAGNYTFRIPAQADSPDSPAGDGFGTVTIDMAGGVKLSGSLADGSKIAQKSAISEQGYWPLYSSLYQGTGCLLGWLQVSNTGTLGGQVVWTKVANHESKTYPGGFTNDVPASGSVYRKPAKHGKVLDWSHGQLILSGGGLAAWTNTITLDLNNKATDSENKLQLNLVAPSGLFKGHIMNPDTGKLLQIQGSVFQDSNLGFGYFLNSGLSGQVILTP